LCNSNYQVTLNTILSVIVIKYSRSFKGEERGPHFIDEFKTYVDEIDGVLHACLTQWLACFCMFKERSSSRCHMLGAQISPIQSFSASCFHVWHPNYGRQLAKNSLDETYDVSHQSAFFHYLSNLTGQIQITSHRNIHCQVHYGFSTTACPTYPPLG
jgi:hypothetical protein